MLKYPSHAVEHLTFLTFFTIIVLVVESTFEQKLIGISLYKEVSLRVRTDQV